MKNPFIITNFKIYQTATADNASLLAKIHNRLARETGASLGIALNALDLRKIAHEVIIPVFSQHLDPVEYGAGTGKILPEAVKAAGATGTLLNHSEYRLDWDTLKRSINRAKAVGLITMVCAATPKEGQKIAIELNPDYIAVEPPELIGGNISVATAQPEIIRQAAVLIGSDKLVIGAGIKTSQDVKVALALGACGILLSSGITKAENPEAILRELIQGLSAKE
jgi:triosephosphate isomerase